MLTLKTGSKNFAWEEELSEIRKANLELLEKAKSGEEQYADSQDWLDTDICAGEENLRRLEDIAGRIREEADAFVLIGVGGSNNAARSVIEAIGRDDAPEIIYAGNTLSAHALSKMMKKLEGKSIFIDCIAKNFETLEPGSSFRIIRQYMESVYGGNAAKRIIATGTPGSSLEKLCRDNGYTFLEFPVNVGGRYTAMTNVGLLPMAVAGVDIRSLVKGAHEMQVRLHGETADENIAYQYACYRNLFYRHGYKVEMLSCFEPQIRWFFEWWKQLFAESEGKDNRGIFPVTGEFSEELHSIGQFIQDGSPILFETFLDVKEPDGSMIVKPDDKKDYFDYLDNKDFRDINRAAFEATVSAHGAKLPCLILEADRLDAAHFGQLFYFFQFACYLSCRIMGVNPFNQPGVELYKIQMFDALGKRLEEAAVLIPGKQKDGSIKI